jgi:hypothetical protein
VPGVNNTIFQRRRAERFAQLLDEANGGRRHHVRSTVDDDLAELVSVGHRVAALRRSVDVQVDPEFRVGLRAMLVAAAEREAMGATGDGQATIDLEAFRAAAVAGRPTPAARRLRTRGAIIAGVACGAIAVSGFAAASDGARPGDALYGVKRSTESVQLALASNDVSRGQLFLDFARNRLGEAKAIGGNSADFSSALDDMDDNTRQGVKLLTTAAIQRRDPAALDAIDAFLRDQRQPVLALSDGRDVTEKSRVIESDELLNTVARRSVDLRRSLTCAPNAELKTDALGPMPSACATAAGPVNGPAGTAPESTKGGATQGTRVEGTDPKATQAPKAPADAPATTTAGDPTPTPSPSASEDSGLVDDVGRLLGGLLD